MIDLKKITKKTIKNLCFGCDECGYLLDVYVYKHKSHTTIWLAYEEYGVFLDNTQENVYHDYGSNKDVFRKYINDFKKIRSYEELLQHFGDNKGWLLC